MSTQSTTDTTVHLSQERLHKISAAYGDTDAMLTTRALEVWLARGEGVEVKTIAADLADANRANPDVNAVSAKTLGWANFAGTAADIIGTDLRAWIKRDRAAVALVIRTVQRVGIKTAKTAITDAVKPIDSAKVAEREEIALTALATEREKIKTAPVSTPRASKTEETEPAKKSDALTAPDALAALRAVTAYLNTGGSWTADLASAAAELTDALSSARKRGNTAAAKTAGRTVETAAA